jgi:hypothetical protein
MNRKGIPIVFDDDGNAYLEDSALESIFQERQGQIDLLSQELQSSRMIQQAQNAERQALENVVSKADHYRDASPKLENARNWINDVAKYWQNENGHQGYMSSGDAINLFAGTEVEEEFNRRYPNVNMVDVITSHDSEWHLKKALDEVSRAYGLQSQQRSGVDEAVGRFDPLKGAGMSSEGSYSDKEIDRLIKAMEREESGLDSKL